MSSPSSSSPDVSHTPRSLPSPAALQRHIFQLLPSLDLQTTSVKTLRHQLERTLKLPRDALKPLRTVINEVLEEALVNQQEEEEENEEKEDHIPDEHASQKRKKSDRTEERGTKRPRKQQPVSKPATSQYLDKLKKLAKVVGISVIGLSKESSAQGVSDLENRFEKRGIEYDKSWLTAAGLKRAAERRELQELMQDSQQIVQTKDLEPSTSRRSRGAVQRQHRPYSDVGEAPESDSYSSSFEESPTDDQPPVRTSSVQYDEESSEDEAPTLPSGEPLVARLSRTPQKRRADSDED